MAEIDGTNENRANHRDGVRLAPAVGEGDGQDLTTSRRFGPFLPGDYVTISANADFFFRTGDGTVTASAASTPATAGAHDYVVPTGVTHIALFASSGPASGSCWKS